MKKLESLLEEIRIKRNEIKKINLSEQPELVAVPEEVEHCSNLESLDISFTSITTLPDFVFKLPNLKHISYLGCESLMSQPTGFKFAQKLESAEIYIPKGHSEIPEDIYALNKIKSLTVQGDIEEWGNGICNIKSLKELHSFDTGISDVPDGIEGLSRLKKVSFFQPLFSVEDPIIPLKLDSIFKKLSKL